MVYVSDFVSETLFPIIFSQPRCRSTRPCGFRRRDFPTAQVRGSGPCSVFGSVHADHIFSRHVSFDVNFLNRLSVIFLSVDSLLRFHWMAPARAHKSCIAVAQACALLHCLMRASVSTRWVCKVS